MTSNGLVRPADFDDASTTPKRRKIDHSKEYDSNNDSGDDLFSEVATLPMEPTQILNPTQDATLNTASVLPSSPPQQSSFVTQPTQPLGSVTPLRQPPVVQVEASSPFRVTESSPVRPPQFTAPSAHNPDGSVKSFDLYPNEMKVTNINLDAQGPQYAGSSSEGSDHELKPTFGSTRKAPSISQVRRDGVMTTPAKTLDRVAESPVQGITSMKALASKLTYKPPQRLDSLKNPSPAPQRRSEVAMPVNDMAEDDVPLEHRQAVRRMKSILPNKPIKYLFNALMAKNGNFDDAIELLTSDDEPVIDLTADSTQMQKRTANRAAGAGRVAIKDKYGHTQMQEPIVVSSPPPASANGRRRLVRGSNRASREETPIEPDNDSDSAAEVEDSDDERLAVEAKVLEYINRCTVKELSDIACTTEDICKQILDQRPFRTLDAVREVQGPAPATKSGKKARGGKARAIGEKVVDICVETWRGYDAVDSLIKRVESMGKPIAEAIKKWGVDIVSGSGSGELEMTDINIEPEEGSVKDSGIGTPTDTADGSENADEEVKGAKRAQQVGFFKTQPKNLKEGTILKDYQIAGINWLNLLYEKKLSCILADEMGMHSITLLFDITRLTVH